LKHASGAVPEAARASAAALIAWSQDSVAGVPLRRSIGHVGSVEVGAVAYDGSNRLWTWSTPLAEDAWGHGQTEAAARQAFEAWLAAWLENFRPFFAPSG
jgi:hypothetical protein